MFPSHLVDVLSNACPQWDYLPGMQNACNQELALETISITSVQMSGLTPIVTATVTTTLFYNGTNGCSFHYLRAQCNHLHILPESIGSGGAEQVSSTAAISDVVTAPIAAPVTI